MGTPPLTDRDLELLRFASEHRLLLRQHVQELLGVSAVVAGRRLYQLAQAGLLERSQPLQAGPAWFRITRVGLRAVGSRLTPPRPDLGSARHDIGLAWLHLAARAGAFGDHADIATERRMRSEDALASLPGGRQPVPEVLGATRWGIRLAGAGARGGEQLHYPDMTFVPPGGGRIALELELSPKSRARRERIMAGYAAARQVDAVLYLVESPQMARSIRSLTAEFGMSDRVHVQYVRFAGQSGSRGGPARSAPARIPVREAGR